MPRDVRGKHLKRIWELEFPEEDFAGQPVNVQQQQNNGMVYQQMAQSQSPGQYQQQQYQQVSSNFLQYVTTPRASVPTKTPASAATGLQSASSKSTISTTAAIAVSSGFPLNFDELNK